MRAVFVWLSLVSAGASRIQHLEETQLEVGWGSSCESLQTRFHNQVHTLRAAIEARSSESGFAQARLAMRAQGLVRTLRRAQECEWVLENDSEDIEEMHGILQHLLSENPCAGAARSELEAGASSEDNAAVGRAMLMLMSDDCVAPEVPPEENAGTSAADLHQAEMELQDSIDQIMDGEEDGDSLIQLDQGSFRSFLRGLGVFLLVIFLLLGCVAAVAAVAAVLAAAVMFIVLATSGVALVGPHAGSTLAIGFIFTLAAGQWGALYSLPVGLGGCALGIFSRVGTHSTPSP